jgi:biotin transport system substrate-specific component
VLLGPTGGYIFGFILAAYMIGKLYKKTGNGAKSSFFINALNMNAGMLVIYACGAFRLMMVADLDLGKTLALGVISFLPADIIKTAVTAYIIPKHEI